MYTAKCGVILKENLMHTARELQLGRRCVFRKTMSTKPTVKATHKCFIDNSVNVLQ